MKSVDMNVVALALIRKIWQEMPNSKGATLYIWDAKSIAEHAY